MARFVFVFVRFVLFLQDAAILFFGVIFIMLKAWVKLEQQRFNEQLSCSHYYLLGKEIMFSVVFVYLSVGTLLKKLWTILMKCYGKVRDGKRNKWSKFGDLDHHADCSIGNLSITKSYEWIAMKFCGGIQGGKRNKWSSFGAELAVIQITMLTVQSEIQSLLNKLWGDFDEIFRIALQWHKGNWLNFYGDLGHHALSKSGIGKYGSN